MTKINTSIYLYYSFQIYICCLGASLCPNGVVLCSIIFGSAIRKRVNNSNPEVYPFLNPSPTEG